MDWVKALAAAGVLAACSGDSDKKKGGPSDSGYTTDPFTFGDDDDATSSDFDGDGYDAPEDCDDDDPDVHPDADDDVCDEVDNDCDGLTDEDVAPDSYENRDPEGTYLNDLTGTDASVSTTISPEGDEDVFTFYVSDSIFSNFGITVTLSTPAELDMSMELEFQVEGQSNWELIDAVDEPGAGRNEEIVWPGVFGAEDAGTYRVKVRADGSSCSAVYDLFIEG